jgi:hypothetical protein
MVLFHKLFNTTVEILQAFLRIQGKSGKCHQACAFSEEFLVVFCFESTRIFGPLRSQADIFSTYFSVHPLTARCPGVRLSLRISSPALRWT